MFVLSSYGDDLHAMAHYTCWTVGQELVCPLQVAVFSSEGEVLHSKLFMLFLFLIYVLELLPLPSPHQLDVALIDQPRCNYLNLSTDAIKH